MTAIVIFFASILTVLLFLGSMVFRVLEGIFAGGIKALGRSIIVFIILYCLYIAFMLLFGFASANVSNEIMWKVVGSMIGEIVGMVIMIAFVVGLVIRLLKSPLIESVVAVLLMPFVVIAKLWARLATAFHDGYEYFLSVILNSLDKDGKVVKRNEAAE